MKERVPGMINYSAAPSLYYRTSGKYLQYNYASLLFTVLLLLC